MINEENVKKIYESVLKGQELTTKLLNGYGFNSKDLADLIKNETLERIKRGHYVLKDSIKEEVTFSELTREDNQEIINSIQECIQGFYEALDKNDFEVAREYLKKLNHLGQIEELKQVLKNTEDRLNSKKGNNKTIQIKNKDFDANDLINQKLEELYKKGIVLLNPMDSERIKEIEQIIESTPNIVSFSIPAGDSRQVVLRVKPDTPKYLDKKEIFAIGNNAYNIRDYDTCISAYRQLLEKGNPKSFVYSKLGFAYLKKHDKKTAIDFLTIANELAKGEGISVDYTEIINDLKGLIPAEDRKRYVRMTTNDFKNDLDDHYGIEQLDQIAKLISTGVPLDEACLNIGLDEEQKNIVALIYAKECYAQENYKIGDQYLKKVERTKNKSKQLKTFIKELRKNKIFYKNRVEEGQKHFVLTAKKNTQ